MDQGVPCAEVRGFSAAVRGRGYEWGRVGGRLEAVRGSYMYEEGGCEEGGCEWGKL